MAGENEGKMIRFLPALLLLSLSAPTWAEWVRYSKTAYAHFYYDPAAVDRDGDVVKVKRILDLKQKGKGGQLSYESLDQFDCEGKRFRTISLRVYSENMAAGELLHWDPLPSAWHDTPPRTGAGDILQILCK
jgi:hypothetical protein